MDRDAPICTPFSRRAKEQRRAWIVNAMRRRNQVT
jgi:hypothetical protein